LCDSENGSPSTCAQEAADRKRKGDPEHNPLKKRRKFARMEAASKANGQRRGRSARRQPNPLSTTQSGGTRASAHGTAKGRKLKPQGRCGDPNGPRSEDASRDPRNAQARSAWPKRSERDPIKACFDGITQTGSPSKFHFDGRLEPGPRRSSLRRDTSTGTDRGPKGLGRNRIGEEPRQRCFGETGPAQRRHLALPKAWRLKQGQWGLAATPAPITFGRRHAGSLPCLVIASEAKQPSRGA
jgi:hypothetical protein